MVVSAYVVNVDCAVVDDGAYLLVERASGEDHAAGALGLPGGRVEGLPDGTDVIERTAVRELREEVGLELDADAVEYVLASAFEADDGTPCLNVVTRCDRWCGEAAPRDADEVAAVRWLSPDEMAGREDVPAYTRRYVERLEAFRDAD